MGDDARTKTSPFPHWRDAGKSATEILNVRTEVTRQETRAAAVVEQAVHVLTSARFFLAFLLLHILWALLNLPIYPWFEPWDPYPFPFLATIASAEAPLLAVLILMRQERDRRIAELREEVNLQVSLHVEREVTMLLRLLNELRQNLGFQTVQEREILERMQEPLDPERLMQYMREDLRKAEGADEITAP